MSITDVPASPPEDRPGSSNDTPGGSRRLLRSRFVSLALWLAVAAVIFFGAAGWLGIKASVVKSELDAAAKILPQLKKSILDNKNQAAAQAVEEMATHTATARSATEDPVWILAGALPWLGPNFSATSEVTRAADDVVTLGAKPLAKVYGLMEWKSLLPSSAGMDLGRVQRASPTVTSAAHAVRVSADRLQNIDRTALFPQVAAPLLTAYHELRAVSAALEGSADAAQLAPDMLGGSTPRKYLLLIQNNAETRATGGIPGALAVMTVDHGKVSLGSQTSATELGAMSPTIQVESEQRQVYSGRLGKYMQDVNLTPDFPTSASVAMAMWQQKTGEGLDGVVSIDPVALSYLLGATGPVTLSDPQVQDLVSGALPTQLNQANVVKTLLSDVYAEIPEPGLQDLYFASVAKEIFGALSSGKNDNGKLIEGISRGVDEGRVLVWSAASAEQSVIAKYPLGGSISSSRISPAQFGAYFNDGTGAKMDFYVKRTAQLIEECTTDGYAQVKVRITSTNTAPKDAATSLPEYVTGGGAFGVPAGTVQTNVVAYGPVQSNLETAFVAGKKAGFASHRHSGRPVGAVTVRLAPGQSSTVEFTFDKIVQHTEPQLSVTPTVQAQKDVVLDTIPAKCVPAP